MQTSESFRLSALLSLSGGLQDAYTYNTRGEVFANAQTGNVVLMGQSFLEGNFLVGLQYMCPLLSFAIGAGVGGVLCSVLGIHTIWISVIILIIVVLMMMREGTE